MEVAMLQKRFLAIKPNLCFSQVFRTINSEMNEKRAHKIRSNNFTS